MLSADDRTELVTRFTELLRPMTAASDVHAMEAQVLAIVDRVKPWPDGMPAFDQLETGFRTLQGDLRASEELTDAQQDRIVEYEAQLQTLEGVKDDLEKKVAGLDSALETANAHIEGTKTVQARTAELDTKILELTKELEAATTAAKR